MKRFYREAKVGESGGILLDGKPVHTPGGRELVAPTEALAEAIAEEWERQAERIDPRVMKLTGLANAAIDRVAPHAAAFAADLARYGESDLLYYRAEGPQPLAVRQFEAWDPILGWARGHYAVEFELVRGIMHRKQPAATVERLRAAVDARSPFELAGLSPLVTVSGSLLIALAIAEGAIGLDAGWAAATVDEAWQAEKWGEDPEAAATLAARRRDFEAGCRFLALLDA